MSHETEKVEFADFEIVRGPERTTRKIPPWVIVRFVFLGLIGLALVIVLVTVGVVILLPLLIFIAITRTVFSLLSSGQRR